MIFSARLFVRDRLIAADVIGEATGQGSFVVGSLVLPQSLRLEQLDYRLVSDNGEVYQICVVMQTGRHVEFISICDPVARPPRVRTAMNSMAPAVPDRRTSPVGA